MTSVCDIPPFSGSATPQTDSAGDDIEIIREEIERYLRRLHASLCSDLQAIDERLTAIEQQLSGSA